jgi:chromosomal replication initiator protein
MTALADTLRRTERVGVSEIIDVVCRYYGVQPEAMSGSSRKNAISQPRQVAMFLARTETDASLPQIGNHLGNRDHSTVLHGYDKIASLVETDAQMRRDIMEIKAMLYNNSAVMTR